MQQSDAHLDQKPHKHQKREDTIQWHCLIYADALPGYSSLDMVAPMSLSEIIFSNLYIQRMVFLPNHHLHQS